MKKFAIFTSVLALTVSATASWYWPFGEDDDEDRPRLSVLMRDASEMIDEASELADDGKIQESVAKYREALMELARVEAANPDRAATPEFASLRNKRAYVNAAIDSLLLAEARANAKAVAITDTTELEKKYLRRKGLLPPEEAPKPSVSNAADRAEVPAPTVAAAAEEPVKTPEIAKKSEAAKPAKKPEAAKPAKKPASAKLVLALKREPDNRKLRISLISAYIAEERYEAAMKEIDALLEKNMKDAAALNLKAMCEASQGDMKAAEKTLDDVIASNPRDYRGYYNMCNLLLHQETPRVDSARRYYETGRAVGGPADDELEAAFK